MKEESVYSGASRATIVEKVNSFIEGFEISFQEAFGENE